VEPKYISHISSIIRVSIRQAEQVAKLVAEGCTTPFIARYRKEATGNLDEVQIGQVTEQIAYFDELEKRKIAILKSIDEQGKLTPELRKRIDECMNNTKLEDIYLPFKPKRKTRATIAIEKGLEPLANTLFIQSAIDIEDEAAKYLTEEVKSIEDALQGARDILAEKITEDERARNMIRKMFADAAIITSKVMSSKKETEEAQKYRDYFDFNEALHKCPSHRLLAIRRAEKEGILTMDISVSKEMAVEALDQVFRKNRTASAEQISLSIDDGYSRLLKPQIETEFRLSSKLKADEEAIAVFTENLRQLLLSSPLGSKRILAIDPGFRTGCKVVCLDEFGNFLHYETIFPHAPQGQWHEAKAAIRFLATKYGIEAIGYGNGTASKETESLVRSIEFDDPISIFMVSESGASIYSASDVAREEFPDQDVTVRGAISIGRRLLDPLSELVKVDPKSIGVGQYQHDVNQVKLKSSLDATVESCVNFVGVDLNSASKHLLTYVSGLSNSTATKIVEYRKQNGPFQSRSELKKVPLLGAKAFEQCAGFLKISDAKNPLDNSSVHPEAYTVVEKMAKDQGINVQDLIQNAEARKRIQLKNYITESIGIYTLTDILKELDKPGRDPRSTIEEFRFADGIKTIDDLKEGMTLPGIVTNITKFGAFVNIGVKQDGMVHVSQMSNSFVRDPNEVVKLGQTVQVTITEVDISRNRVALSMKDNSQRKDKPNNDYKKSVKHTESVNYDNDIQLKLKALGDKFS
jgi:uncharacterized protein